MVPVVDFETSRVVNEFCHLSVLYGDLMPTELSTGMLANKVYQKRNHYFRQDAIRLQLQTLGPFSSQPEWYKFARSLMKRDQSGGFQRLSGNCGVVPMFVIFTIGEQWASTILEGDEPTVGRIQVQVRVSVDADKRPGFVPAFPNWQRATGQQGRFSSTS